MPGHIEPADFILRVGENCHKYGDPYTWCTSCRYTNPERTEVEILGATRAPTLLERKIASEVLRSEGVQKAFYVKRDGDSIKRISLIR